MKKISCAVEPGRRIWRISRDRGTLQRPACVALMLCTVLSFSCAKAPATREIAGLRLSMTRAEAEKRLQEIGTFIRAERRRQEVWELRDPRFSHVVVGYEKEGSLRFVTTVARTGEKAERVAYSAVGSLAKAQQVGKPELRNFKYQWELPPRGAEPPTRVMARGTDPQFLSSLSLVRIDDGAVRPEEDEEDD